MRKIVYYVAISLDGYISGLDDDISGFISEGEGVDKYLADLKNFDTVIMGRKTYEFGYKYGLKPGQAPYPHMKHYIFSDTLSFDHADPKVEVKKRRISEIEAIQQEPGSEIYLCGGGQFAGWLLEHKKIDRLIVKLNPVVLGSGVRLFGDKAITQQLDLVDTARYDKGLQILTFNIRY